MTAFNFLSILSLSFLAILLSFGPPSINAAFIEQPHRHLARHAHHDAIALHKRARRCKPRPSPSPAPTPTSTRPKPSPSPSSPSSFNFPKVGIATWEVPILRSLKTSNVKLYYDWDIHKAQGADEMGYEFIPMLWGREKKNDFQKAVVAGYARFAAGPNEPDQKFQADMTAEEAVGLWWECLEPLKEFGYTLISPATTSSDTGLQWMRDFFRLCQNCHIDMIAAHIYTTNATEMVDYLNNLHKEFQKDIMVTEYACQDFVKWQTCPDVHGFMAEVNSFMKNAPFIKAYFYFGALTNMNNVNGVNQLINPDTEQANALGEFYIND